MSCNLSTPWSLNVFTHFVSSLQNPNLPPQVPPLMCCFRQQSCHVDLMPHLFHFQHYHHSQCALKSNTVVSLIAPAPGILSSGLSFPPWTSKLCWGGRWLLSRMQETVKLWCFAVKLKLGRFNWKVKVLPTISYKHCGRSQSCGSCTPAASLQEAHVNDVNPPCNFRRSIIFD